MIKLRFVCAMCGKETGEFELERFETKPHYRAFEWYAKTFLEKAGWVYQDDVCGDIYCSKTCAK